MLACRAGAISGAGDEQALNTRWWATTHPPNEISATAEASSRDVPDVVKSATPAPIHPLLCGFSGAVVRGPGHNLKVRRRRANSSGLIHARPRGRRL